MLLSLAGFAVFSCGDALIKYQTQSYPVMQCVFFSLVGGIAAVLLLSLRQGGPVRALATRTPGRHAARAFCLSVEFMLVYYAFSALPLATVYTLVLLAPILTVFLSPLFTDDRFEPRLLPAVITGFAGVLIALRPDIMPVSPASLAALLSAFMFATGNCLVRRMSQDEPPLTFAFYPSVMTLAVAGTFMIMARPELPAMPDIVMMMATGLTSAGGLLLLGKALQLAPAGIVMPFQYTQLLWGSLFGLFVFGDRIDGSTAAGAALILVSGGLLAWCERDRNRVSNSTKNGI